ncbi:MAG: hypothetical protein WCY07_12000 [Pigmentiphaga sp.]
MAPFKIGGQIVDQGHVGLPGAAPRSWPNVLTRLIRIQATRCA